MISTLVTLVPSARSVQRQSVGPHDVRPVLAWGGDRMGRYRAGSSHQSELRILPCHQLYEAPEAGRDGAEADDQVAATSLGCSATFTNRFLVLTLALGRGRVGWRRLVFHAAEVEHGRPE
jgi:hypothetical protein